MVQLEELTNLMGKMMDLEIFPAAEKLRMSRDECKLLDPNLIMDARHKMSQGHVTHPSGCLLSTESKRLVQREPASGACLKKELELLDKELKRFERELYRARPKFRGPYYTCSKKMSSVSSDDDDFWKVSRCSKDKARLGQPMGKKSDRLEESADRQGKINEPTKLKDFSFKSEGRGILAISKGEMPYFGSIKITLRGKPDDGSTGRDLHTLKKYLDALRHNALEGRRLREIKITIQGNVATRLKRKYFDFWKTASKARKSIVIHEEKMEEIAVEKKIEMFINAVAERQKELMKDRKAKPKEPAFARTPSNKNNERRIRFKQTKAESSVQNRLNTQKRIIEQQRAKLVEQNRIIEEFRLKQTQEEITTSGKETMCAAKEALTLCGRKTRRTLIQIMSQAGYRSKALPEPLRAPSPPKFLLRMEARAEARRERRKLADSARQKKLEEQKDKEIAAKIEAERELKRSQREAERDARRIRREKEDFRLREIERWKRLNDIADKFYRKYLLRKYILEPFMMLIEMRDNHTKIADLHYQRQLLKKAFRAWKSEVNNRNSAKLNKALSFSNKKLQSRAIECWKVIVRDASAKCQVAKDFYDMKLLEGHFKVWYARYADVKRQFDEKATLADKHYEMKMISKYFNILKTYPEIKADLENRAKRKNELRQIVQTVIPDFDPVQKGLIIIED